VILGLRIDVCTYEGLRTGVPNLLALLARFEQRASFFVALGPDRSGRAVLQLLRPGFAAKMRRTRALRTYGWRTVLSGTLLPARQGGDLAEVVRAIPAARHEVAAHGYDHRRWQDGLFRMAEAEVRREMAQAVAAYERVIGREPQGFGAPGWQCSPASLRALDDMGFAYASDTRGRQPFFPSLDGQTLRTLQIPTTLPTLDEVLGLDGMDGEGYVSLVNKRLRQDPWPVLTLHAEMEGGRFLHVAETLLGRWGTQGVCCLPLVEMAERILTAHEDRIPVATIVPRPIRGRAGSVATPLGLEQASDLVGTD
jgi:peptidoglycan/xylan/chitin deacetylase (PgdA/CDA1 family)